MKNRISLSLFLMASIAAPVFAEDKKPEPPVPVFQDYPAQLNPPPAETPENQQRLYGPSGTLIAPEKAKQILDTFRGTYEKLGKPHVLFFVNRELVDEASNLKITARTEKTQVKVSGSENSTTSGKTTQVSAKNTYAASEKASTPIADRQTVREVERLFGRPFRYAGASLADQKIAASLIADKSIDNFVAPNNEAARKDREALAKIADIVIEVLVSSRNITVTGIAEDTVVASPDIQVTAVRLSDSAIIGQASSTDILGKDQQAGRLARQFDVRDITEATAFALMEDMTLSAK